MAFYRLRSGAPAPSYSYKKRRTTGSSSTQQQLALLKRKVNALKPEVKIAAATGTFTNVAQAVGAIDYLTQIGQGVTKTGRLGDQIRLIRVQFRIQGTSPVATAGIINRIMIVKDTQAVAGTPSITGGVTSIFNNGVPLTMQTAGNMDRFQVLKDYSYSAVAASNGNNMGCFNFDMKCNILTDFTSTGATAASSGKNALYVVVLTDDGTSVQDWAYQANLYFTDC